MNAEPQSIDEAAEETSAPKAQPLKKWLKLGLKFVVTSVLVGWIVTQVEWDGFVENLDRYTWGAIAVVVLLWWAMLFPSVWKWQMLLRVHSLKYRFWLLYKWYVIAAFFNQFLPSMIGGDGYRIYQTLGNGKHRACAVLPVFVERATGLSALLIMGTIGAGLDYAASGNELSFWSLIVGVCWAAGMGVAGVCWFAGWFGKVAEMKYCPSPVRSLVLYADDYNRQFWTVIWAMLLSFWFHVMRILIFWLLVRGLGYDVTFSQIAVVAAATMVIGMLPISLGGWGLVDGAFIVLMEMYDVPKEAGLTAQLMSRVTVAWVAIWGGVWLAVDRGQPERGAVIEPSAEGDDAETPSVARPATTR
ncbi:MAG: lysylphosphatidylglycerol synthase transmembrane domain-containing protein [Planctomycetota bacterium]